MRKDLKYKDVTDYDIKPNHPLPPIIVWVDFVNPDPIV